MRDKSERLLRALDALTEKELRESGRSYLFDEGKIPRPDYDKLAARRNDQPTSFPDKNVESQAQPKRRAGRISMDHHPSCRENDVDLVWYCSKCGEIEPADDLDPGNYQPDDSCPVCGVDVEVVSSDEGTSYYRPVPTERSV